MADEETTTPVEGPPSENALDLSPTMSTAPPAAAPAPAAPAPAPAPAKADSVAGPGAPAASPSAGDKAGDAGKEATPAADEPKGGVDDLLDQLRNLPVSEVDELLDAIERETGTPDDPDDDDDDDADMAIDDSSVSRKGPVRYSEVEPGMQKAIAAVHNHMMEESVKQALDSDESLSYNMKVLGAKARESVVSILKDQMERQIEAEGDNFDYNWARVAQAALKKAVPIVAPFFERPTPVAGMGPGRGSDSFVAQPAKEPTRVPAYADAEDYAAYIAQKMAFNASAAERETQGQVPGV